MWLDRRPGPQPGIAAQAASQPNSRPISPLPRRTSSSRGPYLTSQRPGSTPRASNLSLVSNDSSSSLLGSSKRANGSALKQSVTVEDAPDPVEVLEKLLGPLPAGTNIQSAGIRPITEADLELEFDFGGLGLRELASSSPGRRDAASKPQTIQDCRSLATSGLGHLYPYLSCPIDERDKAKFEELHKSIRACDDILSSVETNLTSFRNDLAAVSADIESLQARSSALNVRLENRKEVEKGLGPVVEELSVSPMVVSKIVDGHIDEAWIKVLADLDKRVVSHKKASNQTQSKALEDIVPLLEKLVLKV